jgi:predicted RNase H-like HicB family nuclease
LSCRARVCIVPRWRRRREPLDRTVELKLKVVVHEAEEGGYWAEVPAIPGCATQGETFEELLSNLYEAVEGCLSVEVAPAQSGGRARVVEIAV